MALIPNVRRSAEGKRSCEYGMRISSDQPDSSTVTADSQTASHDWSVEVSLKMVASCCTPAAETAKYAPVR